MHAILLPLFRTLRFAGLVIAVALLVLVVPPWLVTLDTVPRLLGVAILGGIAMTVSGLVVERVRGRGAGLGDRVTEWVALRLASVHIAKRDRALQAEFRAVAELNRARLEQALSAQVRALGLDLEEHSSDLLWEIDRHGHLCHVSPRLVRLFGMSAEVLCSRPVTDWLKQLAPDDESGQAALARLNEHLTNATPFRDLALPATRAGRTRWWSLTAMPLIDAEGRCTGWCGVSTDITDAHRANLQLTWPAHYDALTGLANRHHFRSQVAELLAPADGTEPTFAVLFLDLDDFKTINDTLGHAVSDGLLQEVAQRLQSRTRRSDTVARLGGDEFAVILRGVASTEEAELLTHRLLDGLQAPCEVQGSHIAVRASIGVAMAPRDGTELDALLNNADLALYAAKSAGRGEFRFFAPQMAALTRRRIIEQALRQALARDELSLDYQPVLGLDDGRVLGFEALLRWQHSELGEVAPAEFVPVAEEAGLITEIGRWVLTEACRAAKAWPETLTVAVNVSPVQAMSPDLLTTAQQVLHDTGLAAQRLELEITESIFLNATGATMAVLRSLREAGVRIALDDFGTGYSSLAYLRRLPFDTLKIDRSFVRELLSRREARTIVKMIVGVARTLHMKVVAEGVEEPAQASVLRRYGCDAMQGYLAARPMKGDEVLHFLADWAQHPRLPLPEPPATMPMTLPADPG